MYLAIFLVAEFVTLVESLHTLLYLNIYYYYHYYIIINMYLAIF